jgi:hypothetical protein
VAAKPEARAGVVAHGLILGIATDLMVAGRRVDTGPADDTAFPPAATWQQNAPQSRK